MFLKTILIKKMEKSKFQHILTLMILPKIEDKNTNTHKHSCDHFADRQTLISICSTIHTTPQNPTNKTNTLKRQILHKPEYTEEDPSKQPQVNPEQRIKPMNG